MKARQDDFAIRLLRAANAARICRPFRGAC